MKSIKNLFLLKELAPSQQLLLGYKQDKNWNRYVEIFEKEMLERPDMFNMLNRLLKYLQYCKDVVLICFEKDYIHCHRYLLAKWFIFKGIEWKEF